MLRYHDPRRFGCLLWQPGRGPAHALLAGLGPEPLSDDFDGERLFAATRKKNVAIKVLIMNAHVVVGVGNIYASESLFMAGVRPGRAAKRITRAEAYRLSDAIKAVLNRSIVQGGTTLRDFVGGDGTPGPLRAAAVRVRARRGAVPALRHGGGPAGARPALDVLVPVLPAPLNVRPQKIVVRNCHSVNAT